MLAEAMGGIILLESSDNALTHYSKFKVTIPQHKNLSEALSLGLATAESWCSKDFLTQLSLNKLPHEQFSLKVISETTHSLTIHRPLVQDPSKVTDAKILIVDDIGLNVFVLKKVLKQVFNMKADGAASGKLAIQMAMQKKYRLIFMDLCMPVMSGVDAAIEILQQYQVTIVAYSARNLCSEEQKELTDVGITSVLLKPASVESISRLLKSINF